MSRPSQRDLPIIALVAIAFGAAPAVAHAYIDPGTAGFVVTTVLGFLAAVGYVVRGYFGRLKRRVFRGNRKEEDSDGSGIHGCTPAAARHRRSLARTSMK